MCCITYASNSHFVFFLFIRLLHRNWNEKTSRYDEHKRELHIRWFLVTSRLRWLTSCFGVIGNLYEHLVMTLRLPGNERQLQSNRSHDDDFNILWSWLNFYSTFTLMKMEIWSPGVLVKQMIFTMIFLIGAMHQRGLITLTFTPAAQTQNLLLLFLSRRPWRVQTGFLKFQVVCTDCTKSKLMRRLYDNQVVTNANR